MPYPDWEQIRAGVADYMSVPRPCVLCARPADSGSAFIPDRPWEFGGAPPVDGKARVILYAICRKCACRPGAQERVERALRDEGVAG